MVLWRKLAVGARLNSWLNNGGSCPFHPQVETINHVISGCVFTGVASSFIALVFPKASICAITRTEESLREPAGLLTWTSIFAHWRLRCLLKSEPSLAPVPLNRYLYTWCGVLTEWTCSPDFSLRTPLVRGFLRGILAFISNGRFEFSPTEAILSPPKKRRPGQAAAHTGLKPNWRELLKEALDKIHYYTSQGWRVVFTDGSATLEDDLGWVGGYGAYFGDRDSFAAPLPLGDSQTNNRAELRALVRVLQIISSKEGSGSWAVATDSSYVVKGVNGGASRWKEKDWIGVAGSLVAHTDLWMLILDLVAALGPRLAVIHVHSHINLDGNDRADALANQGRRLSDHYKRGLDSARTQKRPRPQPPDVAEVELVLSSDEELEERYRSARVLSRGIPIAPRAPTLSGRRSPTPPPPRNADFFRADTPEPVATLDFFSDDEV